MEILVKTARLSYGIMVAALGVQQIQYTSFRPVIVPPWPGAFPGLTICIYLLSIILTGAGLAIVFDKMTRTVSLVLGGLFLLLFIFCQVPYELLFDPYYKSLGSWASAQKEIAFAGGAFVVAASAALQTNTNQKGSWLISLLEKITPFGSILFCITIISFGIDHLLYTKYISPLVPDWIGAKIFWTEFAGVALILSGVCIVLKIQLKWSALLLGLMIFLWLLVLHIPRAVADPNGLNGNEISSVFEAFGFSGTCYLMACGYGAIKKR
jgi:uncharacterized membrane protein YphA (DoxX/SURF4 family)